MYTVFLRKKNQCASSDTLTLCFVEKGIEYLILEISMKSCVYTITLLIRDGQHDFEDYMLEVVDREREGVQTLE